ncbi:MAG: EamA family transporter [Gammaproteobacteria bacterium]|nr:EamA family transporter [Gammaproteobacteria bacterium]
MELSLLSACSKSAGQILTKRLHRLDTLTIAAFSHCFAAAVVFPFILSVDIPPTGEFLIPATLSIFLSIIAVVLLIRSIRRSDISHSLPYLSLTPVFTVLVAFVLRGEVISPTSLLGIFLVVIGALGIDAKSLGDFARFGGRRAFTDTGILSVIFVALIYSVSSVLDKSATLASDPLTYVWFSLETRGVVFLTVYLLFKTIRKRSATEKKVTRTELLLLFLIGSCYFLEAIFQMHALMTGNVAEVLAVKRLSILMTSAAGFWLYREVLTSFRVLGSVFMVAGALLIYTFG